MFTKRILFSSLLLLLALAGPVLAFGPGHEPGARQFEALRLLFDANQNERLDAVLTPAKQELKPMFKQLMEERRALQEVLRSDAATDADVTNQVAKIATVENQLALKKRALIQSVRQIATPEQWSKLEALRAKHQQERAEHRKDKALN
jgi:Spy/CpxP family protein refolding chaperone